MNLTILAATEKIGSPVVNSDSGTTPNLPTDLLSWRSLARQISTLPSCG